MKRITYCIYKSLSKRERFPAEMIKTGLTYEKAVRVWRRNPDRYTIYVDI